MVSPLQGGTTEGQGRCPAGQARPTEVLEVPRLPRDAVPLLVAPCAAACPAPRRAGRRAGQPRPARRLRVYQHGPLPPPADRRCCLLTAVKTDALQGVPGHLWGLRQRQAPPWIPRLLPALLAALRARGEAPPRALTALAQGGGVSEEAATPRAPRGRPQHPSPPSPPPRRPPCCPCRDATADVRPQTCGPDGR